MKKAYSILGIATFFLIGLSAVAQNYTVTDLGLLPGEILSKGWGIVESGQAVGFTVC